tara:strand:+ start:444 stop:896 length:453 start_codon:yes stop_codon:yes gene_type:complete
MGGGKSRTTHHSTSVENPYDDAWIREKFSDIDMRGLGFTDWMETRKANLGREQNIRDQLQAGQSGLQANLAAAQANIENLQRQGSQMSANFGGLSAQQQQQMKDLYNLANQAGSGVYGVQTPQGITFTKPKTTGTGSLNRTQLQTGSLNI